MKIRKGYKNKKLNNKANSRNFLKQEQDNQVLVQNREMTKIIPAKAVNKIILAIHLHLKI